MTIKIEIPSDPAYKPLALAIGQALVQYGGGAVFGGHGAVVTFEEAALIPEKKPAETVAEQASSTTDQNSAAAGALHQSSEQSVNLESAAGNTTNTTPSSETNREQSTAGQDAGAAQGALSAVAGNATDNLDEKGVGFNPAFCSKAAIPFNQTGKKKGQWKRRQGVAEADYDAWHATSVIAAGVMAQQVLGSQAADNVTQIDTAAAFQNGEQLNDGQNHQVQQRGGLTFAAAGDFLQWLAEQQAAELLTHGDIDSAYAATQYAMGDLFDPSKAANAIAAVYNFLAPIAAGQQ